MPDRRIKMNDEFRKEETGAEEQEVQADDVQLNGFSGYSHEEDEGESAPMYVFGQDSELPVQESEFSVQKAQESEQTETGQAEEIAPQEISSYSAPVQPAAEEPEQVQAPVYQQPYAPAAPQYAHENYNQYTPPVQQPFYQAPTQQMPEPQEPKSNKGLKVFAIVVSVLLLLAIGVCAFVIKNYAGKPAPENEVTTTQGEQSKEDEHNNSGAPDLIIGETPDDSASGIMSASDIYEKAKEYNVGIVVYARNSSSSVAGEGTGIIMGTDDAGEDTYIITCAHVISDSGINVSVQTADGTTYEAQIVGFDTRTDLGVIKIKASDLPVAEFGDSTKLRVGDPVYAIGNPGGVEFFGSFTGGYVSAIERPVSSEIGYTMNCIQHDAAINPGNSGGMLVNRYGQVVGINSQKIAATDYEGMGFAIPISDAIPIINDLIDHGYVPNRPKLGITYYPVSASPQYSMIAQINGLPAGTLIIDQIDASSSLANTEVRQYDMIIAVNGKSLTSADILLELIDDGKVGDKLTLTIARINSDYTVSKFEVKASLVEDKSVPEKEEETEAYYVDPFGENGYDFFFGY